MHHSSGISVTSEERIRNLCAQAVAATDDEVLSIILPQLKGALREHLENLRLMAAKNRTDTTKEISGSAYPTILDFPDAMSGYERESLAAEARLAAEKKLKRETA